MSAGAGCTIRAASTPSKAPRSMRIALPPAVSSAGVPRTSTRNPRFPATAAVPIAAPADAAAMMLCPQAWPISGRASYSAQSTNRGPSRPQRATNDVSNPYAARQTSNPFDSKKWASSAEAKRSSKAVSGLSWMR